MKRNPAQREAIAHLDGPMMVLAGPGSGKTSVIVERTARLTQAKIPEENILVVTFSRMAASEMKERFLSFTGQESTRITFGTFHGVFYGILKHAYGLGPENIVSEEEKRRILKDILLDTGHEKMLETDLIEDILKEISVIKNGRLDLAHYHSLSCPDEVFSQVAAAYTESLKRLRKLDFDDMLLDCYRLFIRRPDILEAWRGKFLYILVDEFQDINPLQYDVIRLLAAPKNNLFIVGDDDQAIYRFRGARPQIMLGFEKDYPGAKRVLLDVNYRCSGNILETAMEVIGHNEKRFPKTLTTPNEEGRPVGVQLYSNLHKEILAVASLLERRLKAGESLEDSAVLFRTNQEAEPLIGALLDHQVPFIMREALPNLFTHWICRDVVSYLEMSRGSLLRGCFVQVMNRPNRFLSREAVAAATRAVSVPQREAFPAPLGKLDARLEISLPQLKAFYQDREWMQARIVNLERDLQALSGMPPYAAINYVRKAIGYEKYLKEYARYRRMKAEELTQILDALQDSARGIKSLTGWYDSMERYTQSLEQQARHQQLNREGVTLCTLHASKGLEFDRVIILNVNEGHIPYKRAVLPEELEEERRLFYVGMTRARKELSLCLIRRQGDEKVEPSRFLYEAGYAPPPEA